LGEILSTEVKYVEGLTKFEKFFTKPLKTQRILSASKFDQYFKSIILIKELNTKFLSELQAVYDDESNVDTRATLVAEIFSTYAPAFRLYLDFISNSGPVTAALAAEKKTNARLVTFINAAKPNMNNQEPEAIMITPVQRGPRYEMLLCGLAKTFVAGAEHDTIEAAHNKVKAVLGHINRQAVPNTSDRLFAINKELKAPKVLPTRKYVSELKNKAITCADGPVAKSNKLVACDVYLFNDVLVIKKKSLKSKVVQVGLHKDAADPMTNEKIVSASVSSLSPSDNSFVVSVGHLSKKTSFVKFQSTDKAMSQKLRDDIAALVK